MLQIEDYLTESENLRQRPENFSADNAIKTLKELKKHGQCSFPVYSYSSPAELGYDESGNPI